MFIHLFPQPVAQPRSLLIRLSGVPSVAVQQTLLEDHAAYEIDGVPVFGTVAPWHANHDLLVDKADGFLAGIVYPVTGSERRSVLELCGSLPDEVVRYCVSPVFAVSLLRSGADLLDVPREWGNQEQPVRRFPEVLRPVRQVLRGCLLGQITMDEIPCDLREVGARFFESLNEYEYMREWPAGDVDRVEVTWLRKPVVEGLPAYYPSALDIELAQFFAEDVWYYRQDNGLAFAIGINHLDETLASYGLELPPVMSA